MKKTGMNKRMLTAGLFLLTFVFQIPGAVAQQRALLALSKADHVLAIIDPVTLKTITRVPVGSDPHEVVPSSDGKIAYVSNMGGGQAHEINVIDLVAGKALPNIDTRPLIGPHGLTFVGGKLWFSAEGAKAVGRYDPASGKVDWMLGTGQDRTHMIYVTPDQKKIYTTNVNAGTVSILTDSLMAPGPSPMGPPPPGAQPRRDWVHTVIPVAKGSEGFDVSPDGKQLWTVGSGDGSISVIDLASQKVVATIDAKVLGANRLKFTGDGKHVLITSLRIGDLFIYDVASHKELKRLAVGHGASGILTDGLRAFVACTPDNSIAVIDLRTFEITSRIVLGGPDGLEMAVQH
jgi:YVTN family beta-propeller protein